MTSELSIGVAGYSLQEFDTIKATEYICEAYDRILLLNSDCRFTVVAGLTDKGISGISYRLAKNRRWKTVGVACSKAKEFPCYPVDEIHIIGTEWGDESETFIDSIDILVTVGGGEQTKSEIALARQKNKPVLEYRL